MAPNPRRQDEKLDALYAELPSIPCRGFCSDSCGPIQMSIRERERIERPHGKVECGLGPSCSMLTPDRKCGVYDIRPLICRLWGLTESMQCPYGCKPDRLLTDEEGFDFLRRSIEIGGAPSQDSSLQLLVEASRNEEFRELLKQAGKFIDSPTIEGRSLPKTVIERQ